ncbi:hypothetical protein BKI52_28985 [marine bacterium AO1-C]|nr:hypothetical protein BKI52_28985 [marine bacterium AO1-C]
MKWNAVYHIYEKGALLLIGMCWLAFLYPKTSTQASHWQSFNYTLETCAIDAYTAARDIVIDLREDVRKQGSSREGVERIKQAELLISKTDYIFARLEEAKRYLQQSDPAEQATTERFMVHSGVAYQLKDKLDNYTQWLANEFRDLGLPKFAPLAEGNKKNPLYYALEPDKDFAHNYFESTSAAEAVALITQKQNQVKHYEMKVLKKLYPWSPGSFCCIDMFVQPVLGEAKTIILVGEEYTTDMFIGQSTRLMHPQVTVNGKPTEIKDGQVEINFKTKRIGKQFWQAEILYRLERVFKNKYKTITRKVPFEVLPKKISIILLKKLQCFRMLEYT